MNYYFNLKYFNLFFKGWKQESHTMWSFYYDCTFVFRQNRGCFCYNSYSRDRRIAVRYVFRSHSRRLDFFWYFLFINSLYVFYFSSSSIKKLYFKFPGLSNLQHIDMSSPRNMFVLGISIFFGIVSFFFFFILIITALLWYSL